MHPICCHHYLLTLLQYLHIPSWACDYSHQQIQNANICGVCVFCLECFPPCLGNGECLHPFMVVISTSIFISSSYDCCNHFILLCISLQTMLWGDPTKYIWNSGYRALFVFQRTGMYVKISVILTVMHHHPSGHCVDMYSCQLSLLVEATQILFVPSFIRCCVLLLLLQEDSPETG